jgi:hypothetical protein
MKQGFSSIEEEAEAQENFVRFFEAYDKRRGLDFHAIFPELGPYYNKWKARL